MKSDRKTLKPPDESRRMKFDGKALLGGLLLAAAVPLVMLWQSGNTSKGTSRGWSKYNVYQEVSVITMYLAYARPDNENSQALHPFCRYTLGLYRNGSYAAAWIDHVASKCGECADVRLARAWLFMFMGNGRAMEEEFAAARAACRNEAERKRIDEFIAQVMGK